MAQIGSYGDTVFAVERLDNNSIYALSFSGLTRQKEANYEVHPRRQKKPLIEYTTLEPDTLSMTIYLSAHMGVNPWQIQNKLLYKCDGGKGDILQIGGRRVGDGLWHIKSIDDTYEELLPDGRVAVIMMDISFIENAASKKQKEKAQGKLYATGILNLLSEKTYTVKKDATLWKLAKKIYGSGKKYKKLMRLNNIKNPNAVIKSGTKLLTEV